MRANHRTFLQKNKVLLENGVIRRGHIENNLNNFYNK